MMLVSFGVGLAGLGLYLAFRRKGVSTKGAFFEKKIAELKYRI